jgi:hypothetical protein
MRWSHGLGSDSSSTEENSPSDSIESLVPIIPLNEPFVDTFPSLVPLFPNEPPYPPFNIATVLFWNEDPGESGAELWNDPPRDAWNDDVRDDSSLIPPRLSADVLRNLSMDALLSHDLCKNFWSFLAFAVSLLVALTIFRKSMSSIEKLFVSTALKAEGLCVRMIAGTRAFPNKLPSMVLDLHFSDELRLRINAWRFASLLPTENDDDGDWYTNDEPRDDLEPPRESDDETAELFEGLRDEK